MEYFDLRSADKKQEDELKEKLDSGEISSDNFNDLKEHEQDAIKSLLFKTYSEKVNIYRSLATLEYILFSHMRISDREIKGFALSEEDKRIKRSLSPIKERHDITNRNRTRDEWELDYLKYLQQQSVDIIDNRAEYQDSKRATYSKK